MAVEAGIPTETQSNTGPLSWLLSAFRSLTSDPKAEYLEREIAACAKDADIEQRLAHLAGDYRVIWIQRANRHSNEFRCTFAVTLNGTVYKPDRLVHADQIFVHESQVAMCRIESPKRISVFLSAQQKKELLDEKDGIVRID